MRTLLRYAGLAAALLTALSGAAVPAENPFPITVLLPITGSGAFLGKEGAQALSLLEERVNASGGIRGRLVKFVLEDDQSSPQLAVQLLNAAIEQKAQVVLGSVLAASCNAETPLVPSGPVVYCFSPGIHPPDGSFVFSGLTSTTDYLDALMKFMAQRGWHKIATLTSIDATGQDAERGFDAAIATLPAGRVTIVDRQHFNPTDVSVTAQLAHIKNSDAQALILWSVGSSFGTLLRGVREVGLQLPLTTSAGNLNYAQLHQYAPFMSDSLYILAPPWAAPQTTRGALRRAVETFDTAFAGIGIRPDEGHSIVWDPALLVVDALRVLGPNATAAQIRGYLASLRAWPGIQGAYDFRRIPQRGVGVDDWIIVRWDPDKNALIAVSQPMGRL